MVTNPCGKSHYYVWNPSHVSYLFIYHSKYIKTYRRRCYNPSNWCIISGYFTCRSRKNEHCHDFIFFTSSTEHGNKKIEMHFHTARQEEREKEVEQVFYWIYCKTFFLSLMENVHFLFIRRVDIFVLLCRWREFSAECFHLSARVCKDNVLYYFWFMWISSTFT